MEGEGGSQQTCLNEMLSANISGRFSYIFNKIRKSHDPMLLGTALAWDHQTLHHQPCFAVMILIERPLVAGVTYYTFKEAL